MSGAARKRGADRGAGRATRGQTPAETSSRRGGDRLQVPHGGFDGPASRGSASQSGPGTAGRGSNAPSGTGSPNVPASGFEGQAPTASSRRSSQSGGQPSQPSQPQAVVPQGDPARDRQLRYTDQMKNVDLPPSFYNIDQMVGRSPSLPQSAKPKLSLPTLDALLQFDTTIPIPCLLAFPPQLSLIKSTTVTRHPSY
jgi:hypothetical protein